jgi:H+/gluconate symporter-like permease
MTTADLIGLAGILLAIALLIVLAYRGFSLLLAAPIVSMVAAAFAADPLLANWTITLMNGAGRFVINFFPIFLLGAVFGKLMDDSGSALAIARAISTRLGAARAAMAVVLACAILTYGGVSLFVVSFAVYPVADALFKQANVPHRLIPAAITLGAFTFTMTALPGTPSIQNAIPMPLFGTTLFAAPGLGMIGAAVMLGFGLWWLRLQQSRARGAGEGYGPDTHPAQDPELSRERAIDTDAFDPAELPHGHRSAEMPSFMLALTPILVVLAVNLLMTWVVLPRIDTSFLANTRWGGTSLAAKSGIWSVVTALIVACVVLVLINLKRLPELRKTLDAGANGAVLPIFNTASLAGFGAVVAALPAFAAVREGLLAIPGGPLVSLSVAAMVMAVITASASAALIITLDSVGEPLAKLAAEQGVDPSLMHRVASISVGGPSMLPHSGAIVSLLGICKSDMRSSFRDIAMVTMVGPTLGLVAVIALGLAFGSF